MGQRISLLAAAVLAFAFARIGTAADAPSTAPPRPDRRLARPSVEELRAKAEAGDAVAARELADRYSWGDGVPEDSGAWLLWTRRAAEAGDTVAQYSLANLYKTGAPWDESLSVEANPDEAARWLALALPGLRVAAARGDAAALFAWGSAVGSGDSGPRDVAEAARLLRRAAASGDAEIQRRVGWEFSLGSSVAQDPVEAARWFRAAADQGLAGAQRDLATSYLSGEGVPRSAAESSRWMLRAAEGGDVTAQWAIGSRYQSGTGVAPNVQESIRWLRAAAKQGHVDSQWELGQMLGPRWVEGELWGLVVKPSPEESAYWYREATKSLVRAAERGSAVAQSRLGEVWDEGLGVFPDHAKAATWYRRAAEQGDSSSQYRLGSMYQDGLGVPRSDVQAFAWLTIARANGYTFGDCMSRLTRLEAKMLRAEVIEAQRLAAQFVPRAGSKLSRESKPATRKGDNRAPKPRGSGSGFAISADGYIVTSQHVIASAARVEVVTRSGTYRATVVKSDETNDVSVLKIEARLPALPIVPSKSARLGATVGTVGFPNTTLQGYSPKLSKGEIASLAGPGDDPRYFQISVAVQPGNSGGPLFDERGNVVGIVAAKLREDAARATSGVAPENVNYAIKSSFLLAFLESIPGIAEYLPPPAPGDATDRFEDVVGTVEAACVLILVY